MAGYQRLLQHLPVEALQLDSQLQIQIAAEGLCRFNRSQKSLYESSLWDLIHPSSHTALKAELRRFPKCHRIQVPLQAGPEAENCVLNLNFESSSCGPCYNGWLEKAPRDLIESDEKLQTLIQNMPDLVCFKDGQGRWLEANQADLRLFELEHVQYKGLTDAELAEFSPFYREALLNCIQSDEEAWLKGTVSRGDEIIPRRDGPPLIYDVFKVPTFYPGGRRKGLLVVGRDITLRRAAEDGLREAHAAKSAFLANVSHEIRTPMNGILGMNALLSRSPLNTQQRNWVRMMQNCGENLLQLINDILDLSKIEANQMQVESISTHVLALLEECAEIVSVQAQNQGIDFYTSLDPKTPALLHTDPIRLRQILMNLLDNAVKFTQTGHVHFKTRVDSNGLTILIEDTGIGIARDRLKDLFKPFTQGDGSTTRHFGGTGLGLAICHRLLEMMDGSLQVHSELHQGSRFECTLPLRHPVPVPQVTRPMTARIALSDPLHEKALALRLSSIGLQVTSDEGGADLLFFCKKVPEGHFHRKICLQAVGTASEPFNTADETLYLSYPLQTAALLDALGVQLPGPLKPAQTA